MTVDAKKGEIVIYRGGKDGPTLDVKLLEDTVWLTQDQMAKLFGKDKRTVSEHIRNVFKEKELEENSVVRNFRITARDGKTYDVNHYNLDIIISVGYRVKSRRGTQFRIWATNVLRDHLVKGYTVYERRLRENRQRLKELQEAVEFIKEAKGRKELTTSEAAGLLDVITEYTRSWLLLHQYDAGDLPIEDLSRNVVYEVTDAEAKKLITTLKTDLVKRKEASDLFGRETGHGFKAVLGNINQTFGGKDLYPTVEEKAAHLLYFVIKDHPFVDGNKRIGSLLFIWFLEKNKHLHSTNGERKINDNALVALALLVAESNPKQKDLMMKLIINLIAGNQ